MYASIDFLISLSLDRTTVFKDIWLISNNLESKKFRIKLDIEPHTHIHT